MESTVRNSMVTSRHGWSITIISPQRGIEFSDYVTKDKADGQRWQAPKWNGHMGWWCNRNSYHFLFSHATVPHSGVLEEKREWRPLSLLNSHLVLPISLRLSCHCPSLRHAWGKTRVAAVEFARPPSHSPLSVLRLTLDIQLISNVTGGDNTLYYCYNW